MPNGFVNRKLDSYGNVVVAKEGPLKGLVYWNAPVRALVQQFFKDMPGQPPISIKALNERSHPLIAEFLSAKVTARFGVAPPLNVCVF
jgi:hypothetical protein